MLTYVLMGLTCVVVGAAMYQQYLLHGWRQLPLVRGWLAGRPAPFVSIIVPARNEQVTIGSCLAALLQQSYPAGRYEVVVIDDQSEDYTLSIITALARQHANLSVVSGGDLPPGWSGKCYAIHQALRHSNPAADYLLFVDADTLVEADALTSAVAYAQGERLDLLSLHPFQVLGGFWERTVQPLVYFLVMADRPLQRVNNGDDKLAAANGQFLMVKRTAYDLLGGHRAVRDRIIEDYALAERFKDAGKRTRLLGGFAVVQTRMYQSLPTLWQGWSKNFYLALGSPLPALAAAMAIFIISVLPALLLIAGLAGLLLFGATQVAVLLLMAGLAQMVVLVLMRWQWAAMLKLSPLWALAQPLGGLVVEAILLNSMLRVLSGRGVTWKARRYSGQTSD